MTRRALVLGAGGPAAESWSTGIIAGLADAGVDVRDADLFIGTSAGAAVAAQMCSLLPTEQLFARQVTPAVDSREAWPTIDFQQLKVDVSRAKQGGGDVRAILQRVGFLAEATASSLAAQRRQTVESRLPVRTWPPGRMLAVAVDIDTGERRVFERGSGVELIDAVAASGAAPGVWPVVTIEGRRYMDGGAYSTANADLAADCDRVLVLELPPSDPPLAAVTSEHNIEILRNAGARVEVVNPDEATRAAFAVMHGNLLDPAVRESAARAGRAQGRMIAAARVARLWDLAS
jgi:NTE family protein